MPKVVVSLLSALAISVIFGISIGVVYALVLPGFFPGPGWGTYSPLLWGVVIATLIGGYIGYRFAAAQRLPVRIGIGFCYAAMTAVLVSFLSLFIILNTRGS